MGQSIDHVLHAGRAELVVGDVQRALGEVWSVRSLARSRALGSRSPRARRSPSRFELDDELTRGVVRQAAVPEEHDRVRAHEMALSLSGKRARADATWPVLHDRPRSRDDQALTRTVGRAETSHVFAREEDASWTIG
jgi:hypothetical protein